MRKPRDNEKVSLLDAETGEWVDFIVKWLDRDTCLLAGYARTEVVTWKALRALLEGETE